MAGSLFRGIDREDAEERMPAGNVLQAKPIVVLGDVRHPSDRIGTHCAIEADPTRTHLPPQGHRRVLGRNPDGNSLQVG